MNDIVIRVENVSKEYQLGIIGYGTLYQNIQRKWAQFRGSEDPCSYDVNIHKRKKNKDRFLALNDISFDVKQGEIVGIIGQNGSGKSTLLKLISRVTAPTTGSIKINGRIVSLLEVGTGFHPELTGRENIFLNGTILGMKMDEIKEKFDEIVKFAEVDNFIDTPVKRYSSGMYVRLAFAVAAHLEPEILIIDEVLAVGDAGFQKKCLGKMRDVAKEGRTILFVSHNLSTISSLCSRGILIDNGHLIMDDCVDNVVTKYLENISISEYSVTNSGINDSAALIISVFLKNDRGINSSTFSMTEPIIVVCKIKIFKNSHHNMSVQIKEKDMQPIFHFPNEDSLFTLPTSPGEYIITINIAPLFLYPSNYFIRVALTNIVSSCQEAIEGISFEIIQDYNFCKRMLTRQSGLIFRIPEWSCKKEN